MYKLDCLRTNASTYGAAQRFVKFPGRAYPALAGDGARSGQMMAKSLPKSDSMTV